ncbi:hypothetical protein [Herbaspirillum frisingense]|nr:hypothetical protein [Herbaspirillum frisingense]
MKFRDAMDYLPGVQPIKARQLISVWQGEAIDHHLFAKKKSVKPYVVSAGSLSFSEDDLNELIHNDGFSASTISPKGAGLLIRLYEENILPIKGKAGPVSEVLIAYASEGQTFSDLRKLRVETERLKREVVIKKFEDLDSISDSDFSYTFLDQLFFHHKKIGIGFSELVVGGIKVTKYVSKHYSNSRKNFDYAIKYSGTKNDGTPFVYEKPSRYAENRGNDPERNWGLPE